jgi:hypothetical protein
VCNFLLFSLTDACIQNNRDKFISRARTRRAVSALRYILWVKFCSFTLTDACMKKNPEKIKEINRRYREVSEFFILYIVGHRHKRYRERGSSTVHISIFACS